MISIDTPETGEFIDIASVVPSDFSDEYGEFAETLTNEILWKCHMTHFASFEQNRGMELHYHKLI